MAAGMMSTYAPALPGLPGMAGGDQDYDAAVASGDLNKLFAILERENGLPAGYLARTAKIESGGNPGAKNPNSSAEGLFQFINSTGRAYGLNSSADKRDPVLASLAAAQLAGDNKAFLQDRLGIEPTAGQLYLAHQQGAGGAAKLLANPDAPAASVVGSDAARLNGGAGQTAGQLASRWTSKFGDPAGATLAGMGMMSGSEGSDNLAGGEGGDRVRGINSDAYQPANAGLGIGDFIAAIGDSMMKSKRGAPFAGVGDALQAQQNLLDKREDRRYGMWRDNRDFAFRQTEAQRAQGNTDRSFGLQSQQLDLTKQNTLADNARADAAEKRAADAAALPDRVTTADGSVIELPKGGGAPVVRIPGTKAVTLEAQMAERAKAAKAQGLQEGTPEFQNFVLTGKVREDKPLTTASDRAAVYKAEDALPQIDQTIETLKRAKELNPQTFTGATAGAFGKIGTSIPGAGIFLDEKKSAATREFGQIMSMEAIQQMSQTLKGATTDAEMARFMEILGDPSTPPEIRGRTIDRMMTLAQRQKDLASARVEGLKGGTYFPTTRGQGQTPPAAGGGSPSASSAPKPDRPAAADRFGALIGGGMSKEQAYAKLKEEGY